MLTCTVEEVSLDSIVLNEAQKKRIAAVFDFISDPKDYTEGCSFMASLEADRVHLIDTDNINNPPFRARVLDPAKVESIAKSFRSGSLKISSLQNGIVLLFDENCPVVHGRSLFANWAGSPELDSGYKAFQTKYPNMTIMDALASPNTRSQILLQRNVAIQAATEVSGAIIVESYEDAPGMTLS